MCVD